jgi:DNA helicase-2/ATP-dependent DNA helicase PcrA
LFYVAMTRARERLFLSHAAKRQTFGRIQNRQPSPFIKSIAAQLIENQKNQAGRKLGARQRQLKLFS